MTKKARLLLSVLLMSVAFVGCSSSVVAPDECTPQPQCLEDGWPDSGN